MGKQKVETETEGEGLMLQTACWWISVLPYLFNHFSFFCGTGLEPYVMLLTFTQTGQSDRQPLMKAKLGESLKESKISIHSSYEEGEGAKQFLVTCHLAISERHANEVVLRHWMLSLQTFFQSSKSAFHGVCYIYLVRIASSMCFDFFSMLHFTVPNTCLKLPQ